MYILSLDMCLKQRCYVAIVFVTTYCAGLGRFYVYAFAVRRLHVTKLFVHAQVVI
jgi:hypothetical protein